MVLVLPGLIINNSRPKSLNYIILLGNNSTLYSKYVLYLDLLDIS